MSALRQVPSTASIAVALFALAITGISGSDALAKSKGKTGRLTQDTVVAASTLASPNTIPSRFFTINQVLRQHDGGSASTGPVRLASIDPAGLRGTFSELPQSSSPSAPSGEPFGLFTFRAPEGLLWTKWRSVEGSIRSDMGILSQCRAEPERCPLPEARQFLMIVEGAEAREGRARLEEVNRSVNSAIRYMSDLAQHGVPDLWSAPLATFASGRGDCEDYAIAKYVALRKAGVPADDLRIILARDTSIREAHAVLAARHDGRWLLLDNRRTELLDDREADYLVPLFAIDHHGVKLIAAPYAELRRQIEVIPATSNLEYSPTD